MSRRRSGFTLIEMLTVMLIIAVIAAMAIPAFTSISRSSNLTLAASTVTDQLTRARQDALAQNKVVEVRFYKTPTELAKQQNAYNAFRIWIYDDKVKYAAPESPMIKLPSGIVFMDDQTYSTLLYRSYSIPPTPEPQPGGGTPLNYQYFRFRTTGGTDLDPTGLPSSSGSAGTLPNDKWFVTIKYDTDPKSGNLPAKNYATLLLDPVSGRIRVFRP